MSSHPFPHLADGVTSTVENVDGNAQLATAVVERDATSDIVICRGCTHTLFTLHHSPAGLRLDIAGLAAMAAARNI
jgi:hypothetical protein